VKTCLEIAGKENIFLIPGCEINTQEEVHCLAYFPDLDAISEFQKYLDRKLPEIANDPDLFGYQVAVDENDRIIYEEKRSLFLGIRDDIENVANQVHALGGVFVPAHIDRLKNSIFSQLGFIPFDLKYDALEISKRHSVPEFLKIHPELQNARILRNSDAHQLEDIATLTTFFRMPELKWIFFKSAFDESNSFRSEILKDSKIW
jgi:PHP family Zn ribbon phosphoesterase